MVRLVEACIVINSNLGFNRQVQRAILSTRTVWGRLRGVMRIGVSSEEDSVPGAGLFFPAGKT